MIGNNPIQVINSEKAVGIILSKFSSDFILDVIEDNIKMKFRPFGIGPVNYPVVFEQDFKMAMMENPAFADNINQVRLKTHKEIIDIVCASYNLSISTEVDDYSPEQMYSLAVLLFDIFVTSFTPKMISFFVNYILNNKDDIYNSISDAEEIKKNKETTSYGRKIYNDTKMVVIHSALNSVLTSVSAHDIPFNVLIYYLTDRPTADYLVSLLQDNNDIYKYHYASYIINPITRPDLFTAIKFEMQSIASDKEANIEQYSS